MSIHEITVEVKVLVEAENLKEARDRVDGMSLEQLEYEMDDGEFVGAFKTTGARMVGLPGSEAVKDALKAMGNDGMFFDPDDSQEEDR